ncbi:MAG: DUF2341 domain-containing protein [Moorellales bacterium]
MAKRQPRLGERGLVRIFDWSGGENNAVNPALLNDNESAVLENYVLDDKGTLFPRKGATPRYATPFDTSPVAGMEAFYRSDGVSKLLIGTESGKLYVDTPHLVTAYDTKTEWEQGTLQGLAAHVDGKVRTLRMKDGFESGTFDDWHVRDTGWTIVTSPVKSGAKAAQATTANQKLTRELGLDAAQTYVCVNAYFGENGKDHYPVKLISPSGTEIWAVVAASDGHFKYHNGTALANFPTDKTYVAATWYKIEVYHSGGTFWVWIDGTCLTPSGLALKDTANNAQTQVAKVTIQNAGTNAASMTVDDIEISSIAPVFARSTVAYKQDGTQVAVNIPRYEDVKKVYTEDTQADFASGTLTQVTALASGDLALAKEGVDYSKTETTQADFASGTLTNVVATADNNLILDCWYFGGLRWLYRKPITIDNTQNASALSNYQVLVLVDTASLISAGKMRSDGGDIRFTDSDGTTLLSYWIEAGINTSSTRIWVKVPSVPASATKTIYMYYGCPSATSQSSISNTMDKYEGFESGTFGLFSNVSGTDYFSVQSTVKKEGTYALKASDTSSSVSGGRYSNADTFWDTWNKAIEAWMRSDTTSTTGVVGLYFTKGGYLRAVVHLGDDGIIQYWNGSTVSTGVSYTKGNWYKVVVLFLANSWSLYVYDANYNLVVSRSGLVYGSVSMTYADVMFYTSISTVGDSYLDLVYSRKYTSPEPSVGLGIEEAKSATSGNRVSPAYDVSLCGVALSSTISWNATLPASTSLTIETNLSLDGGVTWQGWQVCTNGGAVPGITKGTNLSNTRLQVRQTLSTTDTTVTPQLHDLTISIATAYKTSGNRVSPSVRVGLPGLAQSSLISWTADTPAGTSLSVEISWDGGTTWLACTNGGALPGISGRNLANSSFLLRESLSTTDIAVTPKLSYLKVEITNSYGKAVWIEEGTTNLFPANLSQSFTAAWTSGALNGTYTVSIKAGTGKLVLSGGASGEVGVGGSLTFTVSNATVTFTPSGGTPQLAQLEQKSYATSWITGGSSRSADNLSYTLPKPLPVRNAGCLWWKPDHGSTLSKQRVLFYGFNATTTVQRYNMQYDHPLFPGKFTFEKHDGTTWYRVITDAIPFAAGDTIFVAWLDDPIAGYMKLWVGINGGVLSEYTLANTVQITDAQKVYWGCYRDAGYECDGVIDDPQLYDVAQMVADGVNFDVNYVNSIYTSTTPQQWGNYTLFYCSFDNSLTISPLYFWISPVIDASQAANKASGHAGLTALIPGASTLTIQSRSASSQTGPWSSWYNALPDGTLQHPADSFVQIKLLLQTSGEDEPILDKLTVSFDGTPSVTLLASDFTAGGQFYFAVLQDTVGIVNGLDAPRKYDGEVLSLIGGNPPHASQIAVHKNRWWLAKGSRLYFSDLLDIDSWPVLNFIDINPNDGDFITGIRSYGDYLVIAKQHSMWLLTGEGINTFAVRRIHAGKGAYAARSLIIANEMVSFVMADGIYFSDLSQAVMMSERERQRWNNLNTRRIDMAASWFSRHKLYVAVPDGSATRNNTVIVFDTLRQAFVGVFNWKASCWCEWREGGKIVTLFGSSENGQVYEIDGPYNDGGTAFIAKWRSKDFHFGLPEVYKRYNKVYLQIRPSSIEAQLNIYFYVDGIRYGPIPVAVPASVDGLIHSLLILASQAGVVGGRYIALEIEQSVLNNPIGIQLATIEYLPVGVKPTIYS